MFITFYNMSHPFFPDPYTYVSWDFTDSVGRTMIDFSSVNWLTQDYSYKYLFSSISCLWLKSSRPAIDRY